jgi:hypothetical protein
MSSLIRNHLHFAFEIAIIFLSVITINCFSQRKSDIPSFTTAQIRTSDNNTTCSFTQFLVDNYSDSCRSRVLYRGWIITKKVGLGGIMGTVFALPGAIIVGKIVDGGGWNALGGAVIGGYLGYIYGSSLGVHIISESENPNSSFGLTLVSGFLSVCGSYLIWTITNNNTARASAWILLPIAFPIIFTELIE